MTKTNLDTLLIILYSTLDDLPEDCFPKNRRPPEVTDIEIVCLSVAQALLDIPSERRFFRIAEARLGHLFPKLPERSVYNKRLRGLAPLLYQAWQVLISLQDCRIKKLRVVDSTGIELAQSYETAQRSQLKAVASSGKKTSHQGFFWGVRLHLLVTYDGDILDFDLTGGTVALERSVLVDFLHDSTEEGLVILGDKGYTGPRVQEAARLKNSKVIIPSKQDWGKGKGEDIYRGMRQIVELVFQSFKQQLSLESLRALTLQGLITRIMQRILAYTAARFANRLAGLPTRCLIAYDH
jgi:hypothetical protein